jgi:hypothetical protein
MDCVMKREIVIGVTAKLKYEPHVTAHWFRCILSALLQ